MTKVQHAIADEIERYLVSGESDPLYSAWSGSFMERANRAHDDLRGAPSSKWSEDWLGD